MELTNGEFIEIKENNSFTFRGINNELFDLVFDNDTKYFKIYRENKDIKYTIQCENSYRTPDLKKLLIAYKYKDIPDTSETGKNIFHYEGLQIANISTTYESYYDDNLKKTVYSKTPKYYTYLIHFNGHSTILSYNDKKYSTKAIHISKDDMNYY